MRKAIVIILFLVFPIHALAADYTVCSSGCDYTYAGFNSLSGNLGGNSYYFSGNISSSVDLTNKYGSSDSHLVIDGLRAEDCTLNADRSWSCSGSRAIINGASILCSDSSGATSYTEIKDFEITGFTSSDGINVFGYSGIIPHDITIRGNYIHDGLDKGIDISDATYGSNRPYNITVEHNEVLNIGTDTAGMDLNISHCRDVIARYNLLWADGNDTTRGIDGVHGINSYNILVENNLITGHKYDTAAENGVDIKGGCRDWIFRYNYIYDEAIPSGTEYAVHIQTADGGSSDTERIYFYCNMIRSSNGGILLYPRESGGGNLKNIYIYSNVITNNSGSGIYFYTNSTADILSTYIYNNTLVGNGISSNTNLKRYSVDITLANIRNNIISQGGGANNRQVNFDQTSGITFSNNIGYDADGTAQIYWGDTDYIFSSETVGSNNEIGNPLFVAAGSYNYALSAGSPAIDNGAALSGVIGSVTVQGTAYTMRWDTALYDSTVWTNVLSGGINTGDQDDHSSWEQGAYIYDGPKDSSPGSTSGAGTIQGGGAGWIIGG